MTKINEVYRCNICGNMVEMIHASSGKVICCGQEMELLTENSVDAAWEKHVPVIERAGKTAIVKVGSIPHPMEETHFIEWVEKVIDGKVCRRYLKPGETPEAKFCAGESKIKARAYCNLHGLWSSTEE